MKCKLTSYFCKVPNRNVGVLLDVSLDLDYNHYMNNEKGTKMTEFETKCYGMSQADIREQYMESLTAKFSGLEMVVMGILSDCQEMLAMGAGPRAVEHVRKQMNVAKYILCEMQDAKDSPLYYEEESV